MKKVIFSTVTVMIFTTTILLHLSGKLQAANKVIAAPVSCATCDARKSTHVNVCQHVSPANRTACMQKAIDTWVACRATCY